MSFKIFTLQLTGKIGNAEKIEAARKKLEQTYHAFLEAECSAELERFRELEKWVASGIPDQRKRELQAEVFKGSLEYNQLREYENLKKNKSFTDYFKVEGSPELTRFLRVDGSDKLKNYWEMKDYAEGEYLQEQREILSQRYAGSAEERLVKELAQLKEQIHRGLFQVEGFFGVEKTPGICQQRQTEAFSGAEKRAKNRQRSPESICPDETGSRDKAVFQDGEVAGSETLSQNGRASCAGAL